MATDITGLSTRKGSKIVSIEDIAKFHNKDKELKQIKRRCGVSNLYKFAKGENIEDMATDSAFESIKDSGVNIQDISGVYASVGGPSSEYIMPGLARVIGRRLGISGVPMMTVGMGCAGGMQALETAYNKMRLQDKHSNCLVIAGDNVSRSLDEIEWSTAPLFSDGVASLVLSTEKDKILYSISKIENVAIDGEGDLYDMKVVNPNSKEQLSRAIFEMNGDGVFMFAAKSVFPEILRILNLDKIPENCYFVPHQANKKLLELIRDINNINPDNLYLDGISTIGNMSGASVFFGLEDVLKRNLAKEKDIVLGAFGAEHAIGAAYLKNFK